MPTHQLSYDLYKEGKTIAEIATLRGLKDDTIYGHLVKMHGEGEAIDLERFITAEEIETIQKAKEALGDLEGLKPLFLHFEEQIPYWKLRLGMYLAN